MKRVAAALSLLLAAGCASRDDGAGAGDAQRPVLEIVPPSPPTATPGPPVETSAPEPEWIAASRIPEFRKCAACHRVEHGAPHGTGPNLFGAFGRRAGSASGYRYSPAMAGSGMVWDFATLDRFLANPRALVPGSKMVFRGLAKPEERKAVIAFLKLRTEAAR